MRASSILLSGSDLTSLTAAGEGVFRAPSMPPSSRQAPCPASVPSLAGEATAWAVAISAGGTALSAASAALPAATCHQRRALCAHQVGVDRRHSHAHHTVDVHTAGYKDYMRRLTVARSTPGRPVCEPEIGAASVRGSTLGASRGADAAEYAAMPSTFCRPGPSLSDSDPLLPLALPVSAVAPSGCPSLITSLQATMSTWNASKPDAAANLSRAHSSTQQQHCRRQMSVHRNFLECSVRDGEEGRSESALQEGCRRRRLVRMHRLCVLVFRSAVSFPSAK